MVTGNEYKNDEKMKKTFYISAGVFAFVLVLNIALYFYNSYLQSANNDLSNQLTSIETNIKKMNEDPSIKLYTLVNANKIYLERYRYLSNIPEFVNNLKELSKKYSVKFEGFSYGNGAISSHAVTADDEVSLWSTKAKKFIEYFRKDNKDIFSLQFVNAFEWQSNVNFNVNFLVK